jgi:hypothetical protein
MAESIHSMSFQVHFRNVVSKVIIRRTDMAHVTIDRQTSFNGAARNLEIQGEECGSSSLLHEWLDHFVVRCGVDVSY